MNPSPIGTAVRVARRRAGWSREALAFHSGLSGAAIAQIESGRRQELRLGTLVALARALGVSVDYLAGGTATVDPKLLEHRALIYDSDDDYVAATVPFMLEGITSEEPVLAVTAQRQTNLLREALGADAGEVEFHDSDTWYRSPADALSSYQSFMKDRFERGARWMRIIGEPVWHGRSNAEVTAWERYESIINLTLASAPATIVCPYDARSVPKRVLSGAHHTHPEIAASDNISKSDAYREPEDFLLTARR